MKVKNFVVLVVGFVFGLGVEMIGSLLVPIVPTNSSKAN
jgi:hypothetical protein